MNEETKTVDTSIQSPFDKKEEVPTAEAVAPATSVAPETVAKEVSKPEEKQPVATKDQSPSAGSPEATPTSTDYAKYADMAEAPAVNERRRFDYVAVSGAVETEVITAEAGDIEKRKPAIAIKLHLTKERDKDDRYPSEELALPLKVVPIKYRMVMEQRTGAKGEILVLKTSEFNGKTTDIVIVNRFSADGKVVDTSTPMTVLEARKKFVTTEGKMALRDKVHLYSLVNGELVRFVVKGTGLWEQESELHNGKTEASQMKYPFLSRYLSEFAIDDPYFLYEMNVNAAYRDHGSIKYYRPIFIKGDRISAEVEATVIEHLEDLHKYFGEMDEATKKFVPTATEEGPVIATETPETPETVVATKEPGGTDEDY